MRDSLLVVFVSFILIAKLARCGAATILDDRDKETQELEELVRKEVFTSLQLLGEDDGDDVEPQSYTMGQQNRPTGNRNAGSRYSNYQYNVPDQETRIGDNSKAARSINITPSSSASAMNTREPGGYTATVTLPSLGGGRLLSGGGGSSGGYSGSINGGGGSGGYSGGVNGGGGYSGGGYSGLGGYIGDWRPSSLIRRGKRRLSRLGNRFGGGGNTRLGYGLGGGLGGLSGGAGSQGLNFDWGGSSGGGAGSSGSGYYDNGSDGSISLSGNGRQGYYGNGRYGLQGDYGGGSGVGGSWSTSGNGLNDYYNLRYGSPNSSGGGSATISLDGASNGRGSGRYTQSSPKDSASGALSTTGRENPIQYELMFVKDQPDSSINDRIHAVLDENSDAKVPTTSEASRDAPGGAGYRVNVSGSGRPRADSTYRVVVVNNDSTGNGSGRSGGSLSSTGSAPGGSGSASWSVSSNGSAEPGSASSRNGFQMTTPITSTQVNIPPTTLVGSVLGSVQGAVSGDQTRSLGAGSDSSGGTIIKLVKTS